MIIPDLSQNMYFLVDTEKVSTEAGSGWVEWYIV